MLGAFLEKPNKISLKEVNIPEPAYGEVRIRLSKIGICGSDVHLYLGHRTLDKPTIIGHEGLGYIDKIGEGVTNREIGERIVIEPNIPCRKCHYCMSGHGNICTNKRVIGLNENGAFAEYMIIPADFAWKVPSAISDDDAVCIEPTAVAVHALFSAKVKPGDSIAVIGLGAIGLLVTQLALALGYKVFVTEINESKIKMATQLGAIALTPTGDLEAQIEILSNTWESNTVMAIFECAGAAHTASLATAAAPRGSEIVLVGLSSNLATFKPLKIAREGITIVPSIIYDHPFDFKRTLQLIDSKVIKPSFIISSYSKLDNLQNALDLAAKGDESKIIVEI
ncbi:L-iditol 2-dehydrogenase/L-gulonate 5-dehydrogenase [Arcicella aurantiaca]|uniref:L-iditol 2-dehydrogenase/L-gulonate 5-dehydrogenase n=1 Tax=Arcicella aurantiaca TaxID=591202 RepID=A0A316DIT5_9BACT|nr:alcohol dehydrogenase catalytic domain-containing protein [Arcicella aurantiaca]PWK17596.1 L-iditol 2-dehydrogenase/L-gulonate 5-dehydrogenase [Arcicella aurantiaca]